ncbi:glycosyltransferase family 2 protein [Flavobacterium sp. UBA6135]|uniref:glycosyltransferase family 2 protein n=1 Tax=Flavobacterium sp. UBA6135 TaxID=1946553 RepID=UPI0025C0C7F0|nr:glycosyltransferase family 2 protein [Flavobacterium sp. UBA6135]
MTSSLKNKISVLIITLNEEAHMKELLSDLTFAEEVIVVDSFSTDKTKEICLSFENVKFIEHKFENYTSQRNVALDLATHSWVLFLDADERITPRLKDEILHTISLENTADAYFFLRKFMFQNKPLHFSGWQTDKNIRLFKKEKARYIEGRLVHEKLKVDGTVAVLKNKLIHYSYLNYETYKSKMVNYGRLKAKELFAKNVKPNFFHFYIKPAYKFFNSYFIRLGILDGKKGIIICYLNALSVYVRYPELDRLIKKKETN